MNIGKNLNLSIGSGSGIGIAIAAYTMMGEDRICMVWYIRYSMVYK